MKAGSFYAGLTAVALGLVGVLPAPERAAATTILNTADNSAVLGASTVTNTGPTTITGGLGLFPGTSITGFFGTTENDGPGIVAGAPGSIHQTDAVAMQAQTDASTAFGILKGLTPSFSLTGEDLGGLTLNPGVYSFGSSADLTGTLTLDFTGPDQDFVFQIGSTLTTASGSSVIVDGGDSTDGIFFDVGSSATLGTATTFQGNILADASISLNTAATDLCGRVIALTGAVTMDDNTISDSCAASNTGYSGGSTSVIPPGSIKTGTPVPAPVPEPSTLALFGGSLSGLLGLAMHRRRVRSPQGSRPAIG